MDNTQEGSKSQVYRAADIPISDKKPRYKEKRIYKHSKKYLKKHETKKKEYNTNNKPIKHKLRPFKGNKVLVADIDPINENVPSAALQCSQPYTPQGDVVIGGASQPVEEFRVPNKLDFQRILSRHDYKLDPTKALEALHTYASQPGSFNDACKKSDIDPKNIFAAMVDTPEWENLYKQALKAHSHIFVQQIDSIVTDDSKDLIITQRETSDGRAFNQVTINNARVKRDDIRSKMYLALSERLNSDYYSPVNRADTRNLNINANIDVPSSDLATLPVAEMLRGRRNQPGSV